MSSTSSSYLQKKSGTSDFLGKVKYLNTLPPVPVEAKLLHVPLDIHRYIPYALSTVEKNLKYDLHFSILESVPLSLVDMSIFPAFDNIESLESVADDIPDEDKVLLSFSPDNYPLQNDSAVEYSHSRTSGTYDFTIKKKPQVSWLRKSDSKPVSNISINQIADGNLHKGSFTAHPITLDRAISTIEKTFQDAAKEKKHPMKPDITAKRILPIFPDTLNCSEKFSLFVFDSSPCSVSQEGSIPSTNSKFNRNEDTMKQVRGFARVVRPDTKANQGRRKGDKMIDSPLDSENYMHFYTGTDDSLNDNAELRVSLLRPYSFTCKEEDNFVYAVSFNSSEAVYHPIESKVVLKVLRPKTGSSRHALTALRNTAAESLLIRRQSLESKEPSPSVTTLGTADTHLDNLDMDLG